MIVWAKYAARLWQENYQGALCIELFVLSKQAPGIVGEMVAMGRGRYLMV